VLYLPLEFTEPPLSSTLGNLDQLSEVTSSSCPTTIGIASATSANARLFLVKACPVGREIET
jgi:hypothetical protein